MSASQTNEDHGERVNRELIELLNELRVALPEATSFQRALFLAPLLCTAISAALLIAPSAYHRIHFRQHAKEELLVTSNRLLIAGLGFLALAMVGAIVLITDVIYGPVATVSIGLAAAAVFGWFWAALPLVHREDR